MTYELALMEREERGREEERNSIAQKMILYHEPFEKISEFTKLSVEYLKKLADNIHQK